MPQSNRCLGVTVLGDFLLSEGVENVLANLQRIGATAVACNPTVTAPAPDGVGSFQPPSDAGMSPRRFDRPLFGKPALWVRSGPSFRPRTEFYADSPYRPRQPNELTDAHGPIIGDFIQRAANSGLKVFLQIGAAEPTGLRDEDRPRLPNGEVPRNRVADTASLASAAVRAYNHAYVRDLFAAYPQISGLRIDWPEYPCYTFGEAFQDFGPHVAAWAETHGFDFAAIHAEVRGFFDALQGRLTNEDLEYFSDIRFCSIALTWQLQRFPDVTQWLRLKAALATETVQFWRELLTDVAGTEKELCANAFMPPYSFVTGFDFEPITRHCDMVSPKFYTMHWSMMVELWGRRLLESNPGLDEQIVVRSLVNLMDLSDDDERQRLADYGYPGPDDPHPIPNGPQLRKLSRVCSACGTPSVVVPSVHGYGPAEDFRRRLNLVVDSDTGGVWLNRYGYLSDEKLDVIAECWR
jgi:hypothetical protein